VSVSKKVVFTKYLCGSVGKVFVCQFESQRLGMANWFGAHYNWEVRFSSVVKCKKGPLVLTSLLNPRRYYYYYCLMIESLKQFEKLWTVPGQMQTGLSQLFLWDRVNSIPTQSNQKQFQFIS